MTQLTCRVCGQPRSYQPSYGLELCWPCYLAHAGKRDRKDQESMDDVLSEAGRLATQTPYEAGYRDGYAHGRLLTDHGRTIEGLLAAAKAAAEALTRMLPYLEYQTVMQRLTVEVRLRLKSAIEQAEGKEA